MFKQLLQTDKLIHNLINCLIVFVLAVLTNYFIGLATAIVASFFKEYIWDKWFKQGQFKKLDLIANGLGMIEGTILYLIYIL